MQLSGSDLQLTLDGPTRSRQGQVAMTTARTTRIPAMPVTGLAGVFASFIFVVILILPH
jgi:hypothetical protein